MRDQDTIRGAKRLFLAVALPDYIKESLGRLQEGSQPGFHWVPWDQLHLTLRFIGDVPGQAQPEIEKALDDLTVRPFLLPVEGVGRFPEKGSARVLWAGLGNAHPHLFQLKKRMEDALFQIGLEPEKQIYRPHLTLARVNKPAVETVKQFLKRHHDFAAPPFRVESFTLYWSVVREGRRLHLPERVWPLRDS